MKFHFTCTTRISIFFVILTATGCKGTGFENVFSFSKSGVVRVSASEAEVLEARTTLLKWNSSQSNLDSMKGGILFDGVVSTVSVDEEGNHAATIQVTKVLIDSEPPMSSTMSVVTPPTNLGGTGFQVTRRYCVYAVKLEGKYQTWAAAGTVALTESG